MANDRLRKCADDFWCPAEALGFCIAILAFFCVLGYAYDAKALYGIAAPSKT